jgi:hypothetical protein
MSVSHRILNLRKEKLKPQPFRYPLGCAFFRMAPADRNQLRPPKFLREGPVPTRESGAPAPRGNCDARN